jgi:maleylacetoacetate isomerase
VTEVVLYDYWRSSAAYRLRIGLGLLGLGWRAVPVNLLTGEHKAAANLARNPQGLVPTLEIDGLTLTQSLAILEYLDETRGAGWLPGDPAGRARVRALAYAIAMEIHPVCNLSVARFAVENSGGGITMES